MILDRLFLDANVLYSAAYLEHAGIAQLWKLEDVELVSSEYAIEEARRNLELNRPAALARLRDLVAPVVTVNTTTFAKLPSGISLDPKDQPILLAAIHGKAGYLLTSKRQRRC